MKTKVSKESFETNKQTNKQTNIPGLKFRFWFGLVGFSFNASLEPQLRAQKVPYTRLSPDL